MYLAGFFTHCNVSSTACAPAGHCFTWPGVSTVSRYSVDLSSARHSNDVIFFCAWSRRMHSTEIAPSLPPATTTDALGAGVFHFFRTCARSDALR